MNKIFKKNIFLQLTLIFLTVLLLILGVSFVEQKNFKQKRNPLNAAGACPGGYVYLDGGDFCIEVDLHDTGDQSWEEAAMSCLLDDAARLCSASEWVEACRTVSLNDDGNQWEWVDDFSEGNQVFKVGETGCDDYEEDQPFNSGQTEEFRCCKNAST